jgi:hypothetical protein
VQIGGSVRSRAGDTALPSVTSEAVGLAAAAVESWFAANGLHLKMQSRYNTGMSTSTVGFAVADEDQERLARLVEHFGHGNRSAYLRATLPVMESLARAERLRELQARNAERAAAAGQDYESLLAEIRRAYKGGTPGK